MHQRGERERERSTEKESEKELAGLAIGVGRE